MLVIAEQVLQGIRKPLLNRGLSLPQHLVINETAEPPLILDTEITEELRKEGFARDLIRHIQQIRKNIGLEIQDRIKVGFESTHEAIEAAMTEHKAYICLETLCDEIEPLNKSEEGTVKEVKIGGASVRLQVTQV